MGEWKTDATGGHRLHSGKWMADIKLCADQWWLTIHDMETPIQKAVVDRRFSSLEEAKTAAESALRAGVTAAGASPPGIKHDDDKQRWDLLPYDALEHVVKVLTLGAKKYAEWNWMYVERAEDRYFAAAQRHLVAWRGGEGVDPETGVSHIAHAICCLLFLLSLRPNHGGKPQTAQK